MSLQLASTERESARATLSSNAVERSKLINKQDSLRDISTKNSSRQPLTFLGSSFTADAELAWLDDTMQQDCHQFADMASEAFMEKELANAQQRGEYPSEHNMWKKQQAYAKAWTERINNYWKQYIEQIERRIQMQLDDLKKDSEIAEKRMAYADQLEQKGIQQFGKSIGVG